MKWGICCLNKFDLPAHKTSKNIFKNPTDIFKLVRLSWCKEDIKELFCQYVENILKFSKC